MQILVLGGLGEVGMNCLALEQGGQVLVIDCGVTFDDRGLGIDVVHPDLAALDGYRVAGLFVTHGHEDHIGAIPYFLRRHDVPVYGPAYALSLLRERAAEHEVLAHADLRSVKPRAIERVGPFEVEPVRVTHSIADATALAVRSEAGLVVHTGDFKFDEAPPDGEEFDVERFGELGREGVDLLFSDSTNIDASGPTGSEEGVGEALEAIVAAAEQAVVVAVFASNVHRLRMLGEIARRHGRKIVPLGRSVSTHARVAQSTPRSTGQHAGRPYLEWPPDLVWPSERARELAKRQILSVATGSQGEKMAALARLARGDHPSFDLGAGDVVVLSSRVIPGHEPEVMQVMNGLLRREVDVRSWHSNRAVHVSGHAHRQEQRRMLELARPRAFVPVHGTLHHLRRHAELAREVGVEHVTVLENGDVAALVRGAGVRKTSRFASGRVHVAAGRALPAKVIAERGAIASLGVVHVSVAVDADGRLAGDIGIATRGVLDGDLDGEVVTRARGEARRSLEEAVATGAPLDDERVAEVVRLGARREFARTLGFKPVTTASVVRVGRLGDPSRPSPQPRSGG
ncbi:MAG TPA: ribonuclease J [Polyangiaceae bacterium]|nr:ribonuclease J [Polyangiaceae bacterium]